MSYSYIIEISIFCRFFPNSALLIERVTVLHSILFECLTYCPASLAIIMLVKAQLQLFAELIVKLEDIK